MPLRQKGVSEWHTLPDLQSSPSSRSSRSCASAPHRELVEHHLRHGQAAASLLRLRQRLGSRCLARYSPCTDAVATASLILNEPTQPPREGDSSTLAANALISRSLILLRRLLMSRYGSRSGNLSRRRGQCRPAIDTLERSETQLPVLRISSSRRSTPHALDPPDRVAELPVAKRQTPRAGCRCGHVGVHVDRPAEQRRLSLVQRRKREGAGAVERARKAGVVVRVHDPGGACPVGRRQGLVESLHVRPLEQCARAGGGGRDAIRRRGVDDPERLTSARAGAEGSPLQVAQPTAELEAHVLVEGDLGVLGKLLGYLHQRRRLEGRERRLGEGEIGQRVARRLGRPAPRPRRRCDSAGAGCRPCW